MVDGFELLPSRPSLGVLREHDLVEVVERPKPARKRKSDAPASSWTTAIVEKRRKTEVHGANGSSTTKPSAINSAGSGKPVVAVNGATQQIGVGMNSSELDKRKREALALLERMQANNQQESSDESEDLDEEGDEESESEEEDGDDDDHSRDEKTTKESNAKHSNNQRKDAKDEVEEEIDLVVEEMDWSQMPGFEGLPVSFGTTKLKREAAERRRRRELSEEEDYAEGGEWIAEDRLEAEAEADVEEEIPAEVMMKGGGEILTVPVSLGRAKRKQMKELMKKERKHIRFGKGDDDEGKEDDEEEDEEEEEEHGDDAEAGESREEVRRSKGEERAQASFEELASMEVDVERPANIKFTAVYLYDDGYVGQQKRTANGTKYSANGTTRATTSQDKSKAQEAAITKEAATPSGTTRATTSQDKSKAQEAAITKEAATPSGSANAVIENKSADLNETGKRRRRRRRRKSGKSAATDENENGDDEKNDDQVEEEGGANEPAAAVENNAVGGGGSTSRFPRVDDRTFETLKPIKGAPGIGTIIAYKIVELGDDYVPRMGMPRVGEVVGVHASAGVIDIEHDGGEVVSHAIVEMVGLCSL
ncbi:hypothetical protein BJ742DRAFT_567257 [Cladochytrium replicatum]|nr:hypothetical protein BJ742DRAFT_567257 [Cladochytrium replicatum]